MLIRKIISFIISLVLCISFFSTGNINVSFANSASQKDVPFGWFEMDGFGGNLTKTDNGITIEGSKQQGLFNYFYGSKLSNLDGFSTMLLINSISKTNLINQHDTYLGIQFGSTMSQNLVFDNLSPGMMLIIRPNALTNTYDVSILLNNGTGITGGILGSGLITLAEGGAINLRIYKESSSGTWHLLLNGMDMGVNLSSVSSLLSSGAYFGVKAYENNITYAYEQAVSLTVQKINGQGLGNHLNIESNQIIKSSKSNIDPNATATKINGAIQLTGKASNSTVYATKFALGDPVKNLNGFSTNFNIDELDGYNSVNGVSNSVDFALTTFNATSDTTLPVGYLNSDRLDVWDYYNSSVPWARGVEVRLKRMSDTSLVTQVFIIGTDGQFTIPNGVIGLKTVTFINNEIEVSLVKNGANWDILLNGFSILNETDINKINEFNTVIDALSTYGATPVYTGSYDSLGSPAVEGNISLSVKNINGRTIGSDVNWDNNSISSVVDNLEGYTEQLNMCKTISDFEYGLESIYDRVTSDAPHYWDSLYPVYSYTSIVPQDSSFLKIGTTQSQNIDNNNYWYMLPSQNGSKTGYVDVIYTLNIEGKQNYEDFSSYNKLRIKWQGVNLDSEKVSINASIFNASTNLWINLGTVENGSNIKSDVDFDMNFLTIQERQNISQIRFRTYNKDLGTSYQKNCLYNMDVFNSETLKSSTEIDDIHIESENLGNVIMSRYGAYSASGFYDTDDKKWKMWYGCGIPEGNSSDNVYYIETTDPKKEWSKPLRLIINDPSNILIPYDQPPGYGGDPSVIKVNDVYYMYMSTIDSNPESISYWYNKIYLATSTDGINYTLYNQAIVDCNDGGAGGYGTGSPSVVYKDGLFYLYYYSQNETPAGCYRRVSSDGFSFGEAVLSAPNVCYDVKYIDSLNKWVGTYYTEQNQELSGQSARIRLAFSDDGLNWTNGIMDSQMPEQDNSSIINHNPGLIGDQYGHGYSTMFLTYGINEFALSQPVPKDSEIQMDTRQLGWSRITLSKWQQMYYGYSGCQTKTDNGMKIEGIGKQNLFNYFYNEKLSNLDGFSSTILINSIAKTNALNQHDTYLGMQFGSTMSQNLVFDNSAPGMMLIIRPLGTPNTYDTSILLNNGTGITGGILGSGLITLSEGGAINLSIYKDSSSGSWHLLLNGIDMGVNLSSVSSLLSSDSYFGVKAYENNATFAYEQAVSLCVQQINGQGQGNYLNIATSEIIKSSKSNVDPNATATKIEGGILLKGKASSSTVFATKFAMGNPVKNLNGFSTSFRIDELNGYVGIDGVSNSIDFALTTYNATSNQTTPVGYINSDRIDVLDYANSPVIGARGIQVRLRRTSENSMNTEIYYIGTDGQFTALNDIISSKTTIYNSEVTINLIKKGVNWDVLLNGVSILNETNSSKINAFNAELNAISTYGATPSFSGRYDSLGTPSVEGDLSLTVNSINARPIGSVSIKNIIKNIQPESSIEDIINSGNLKIAENTITVYRDYTGTIIDKIAMVGTGASVEVYYGETLAYTNSLLIYGDVNGDGSIDLSDLVLIKDYLLEDEPVEGIFKLAGDLYGEGNITLNVLVGMMAYVSESGTINQERHV